MTSLENHEQVDVSMENVSIELINFEDYTDLVRKNEMLHKTIESLKLELNDANVRNLALQKTIVMIQGKVVVDEAPKSPKVVFAQTVITCSNFFKCI